MGARQSNGLKVAECTLFVNGSSSSGDIMCLEKVEDDLIDLCGKGSDIDDLGISFISVLFVDCNCVVEKCMDGVNKELEAIIKRKFSCDNIQLGLCPPKTFKEFDLDKCIETNENEDEICNCIFDSCGELLDLATFLQFIIYAVLVIIIIYMLVKGIIVFSRSFSEDNVRHFLLGEGKTFLITLLSNILFNILMIIVIIVETILILIGKEKDLTRTVSSHKTLQYVPFVAANLVAVLSYVGVSATILIWIHIAYKIAQFYDKHTMVTEIKAFRFATKVFVFVIGVLAFFGSTFNLIFDADLKFNEANNLTIALIMLVIATTTLYARRKILISYMEITLEDTKAVLIDKILAIKRISLWIAGSALFGSIGYFLDAFDVVGYANYSLADFSFWFQMIALTTLQSHLLLYTSAILIQKLSTDTLV